MQWPAGVHDRDGPFPTHRGLVLEDERVRVEPGQFLEYVPLCTELTMSVCKQVANMVYIESPAGVGFSYAEEEDADFRPDDASTADLNYALIQVPLLRSFAVRVYRIQFIAHVSTRHSFEDFRNIRKTRFISRLSLMEVSSPERSMFWDFKKFFFDCFVSYI